MSPEAHQAYRRNPLRRRMHEIIFEADTHAGKIFDAALLVAIIIAVITVMLDSVKEIQQQYSAILQFIEWTLTLLFTIEYGLRLWSVRHPLHYAKSFFGIVDLLAILPAYLSLIFVGSQSLMVIRVIRLLRVFRIFKMARYLSEVMVLMHALRATRHKITVFLMSMLILALILGTLMYVVEGEKSGFASIPAGFYWAIVTLTTVGYGDLAPLTLPGQVLAAVAMLLGYSMIIIPIGIFAVEVVKRHGKAPTTQACPDCMKEGHDEDAIYCKYCGGILNE
ncbi:MAG: ion transporter [Candidatus Sedimenticola sp. (ex Thyasira tokunagai)]